MSAKCKSSQELLQKTPLRIFLADPVHDFVQSRDIWTIPLNILNIAAYVKAAFGERVEILMFKFPGPIFSALKKQPPDIIGVSNYIWNFELSKTILRFAKKRSAHTVTVMGGPNVKQTPLFMKKLLQEGACDYYISWAGEHPFRCLVESMLSAENADAEPHEDTEVHGVWYTDPATGQAVFKPVKHIIKDLDQTPSPFSNGMADEFFQQDLMPMIETHRGCPFSCTYCNWGNATMGKVYQYSPERVKQDIDYCCHHATDERLMINDANFGQLGSRDLEIANYIKRLRDTYGWPGKVIVTWGQAKSDDVLQVAGVFKELSMMTQSSQSMHPEVLKNIKRRNISDRQWRESVAFCRQRGIETYGELMLPLPGETLESYLSALRYLFDLGVDFINTNPLILLEGAEMNADEERSKHRMVTKWRLLENCYGVYWGAKVIESQEMVIQTSTFSKEDYFLCRTLSWLIQMSWNLQRHDLLLRFLQPFGVNPVDFFIKAILDYKKAAEPAKMIFEKFFQDAREELFDTRDDLIAHYSRVGQMESLKKGRFRKLNTYYTSRVSLDCNRELFDYYGKLADDLIGDKMANIKRTKNIIGELSRFAYNRYLTCSDLTALEQSGNFHKKLRFHYDILEWQNKRQSVPLEKFHIPDGVDYYFSILPEQKKVLMQHMERFSGLSTEYLLRKLQEPYHGVHKKNLFFHITRN